MHEQNRRNSGRSNVNVKVEPRSTFRFTRVTLHTLPSFYLRAQNVRPRIKTYLVILQPTG